MKKILSLLLITMMIFTMVACQDTAKNNDDNKKVDEVKAYPVTVKDARGVDVTIEEEPTKVIAMIPSDAEIIYGINAWDKVIAVGQYVNYPEESKDATKVGTGKNTSIEELIALEADLILFPQMAQSDEQIKTLEDSGVKVFVSSSSSLNDTYEQIENLGKLLNKTEDANKLVKTMKDGFAAIKDKAKDRETVNAYVEISPLAYGLWTCGNGTFQHELLDLLGVKNVFGDVEGWKEVSEEQVIDLNPDVIITTSYYIEKPVDEILGRENWKDINAVKNNKVFLVNPDILSRPSQRLLEGVKELEKVIYGE